MTSILSMYNKDSGWMLHYQKAGLIGRDLCHFFFLLKKTYNASNQFKENQLAVNCWGWLGHE